MGFLVANDYNQQIRESNLNEIIENDDSILKKASASTRVEMESYLRGRFDIALMFFDVVVWDQITSFAIGQFVLLLADLHVVQNYTVGQLVRYGANETVYRCILNTTTNQLPSNGTYWEAIGTNETLYTVILAGTNQRPNNATYFTERTPRNPLLIRLMIDLLLYEIHCLINPRMIPEHRIVRRNDVIKFLRDCSDQRKNMSPDFPLIAIEDDRGASITGGFTDNAHNSY